MSHCQQSVFSPAACQGPADGWATHTFPWGQAGPETRAQTLACWSVCPCWVLGCIVAGTLCFPFDPVGVSLLALVLTLVYFAALFKMYFQFGIYSKIDRKCREHPYTPCPHLCAASPQHHSAVFVCGPFYLSEVLTRPVFHNRKMHKPTLPCRKALVTNI